MSAIQKFREVTKVLNELSTAAVNARSEVEHLLINLNVPDQENPYLVFEKANKVCIPYKMLNSYNDTDQRKAELLLQLLATKEFITCDNIIKSMCHGDRTYANVEEVTRRLCGISSEAWVSELSQKKMLVSEILQKEYIPAHECYRTVISLWPRL